MSVSVLIPAFRPTYLAQAIASVLAQGFEDFELIVSDDSGGEALAPIVERFRDPRIRYRRTAGRTGARANIADLWGAARRERLKFLFDDDLLLPNALVELQDRLADRPGAALVFGHRDIIDAQGRVRAEPRLVAPNAVAAIAAPELARHILARCHNPVGELSNVLINRACGVELEDLLIYRGVPLAMMGDVGLYLNAGHKGAVVGVGRTLAQFRRHEDQNSSWKANAQYAKVVGEWELFLRGEYAAGVIDAATAESGAVALDRLYALWEARLPEVAPLRRGLPRLRERIAAGDRSLLDDGFHAAWADLDAAVAARQAAAGA